MNEFDGILEDDWDASKVESEDRNAPLPAGWWPVVIERAEMKDTAKGGKRLALGLKVEGAQRFNGKWVWASYNLVNANQTAVDIAKEEFARLCQAVGIVGRKPKGPAELEGKSLDIRTEVRKSAEYGDREEIKGYAKRGTKTSNGAGGPAPTFDQSFNDDDIPF